MKVVSGPRLHGISVRGKALQLDMYHIGSRGSHVVQDAISCKDEHVACFQLQAVLVRILWLVELAAILHEGPQLQGRVEGMLLSLQHSKQASCRCRHCMTYGLPRMRSCSICHMQQRHASRVCAALHSHAEGSPCCNIFAQALRVHNSDVAAHTCSSDCSLFCIVAEWEVWHAYC